MTTKIQRTLWCRLIAIFIALAVSQAAAVAQGEAPKPGLIGVWEVRTVPRNCVTGNPIPSAAFESVFTFHAEGTMLVSMRNQTVDLERTAFHGLWRHDRGWSDYSFKHVHLRQSVSTGLFPGKQEGQGGINTERGRQHIYNGRIYHHFQR